MEMLALVFYLCVFAIFGKLSMWILKGIWGLTKFFFTVLFLPLILIGLLFSGFIFIVLPVIILIAVVVLIACIV